MGAPSPTKRSIDNIKSKILQPALTSHFECSFALKDTIKDQMGYNGISKTSIDELLILSCSEANLPGSSIATHELNNDFTGVTQRHAYRRLYDDRADFTFYVDSNYTIIRAFEAWIRYAVGEQISGELSSGPKTNNNYRVRYPKDYKTTIYITKFERDMKGKMTYTFVNAFPISINSMPVSYDSSQLLKCTVSFTYDRYFSDNLTEIPKPTEPSQFSAVGAPDLPGLSGTGALSTGNGLPLNIAPNQGNSQFNIGAGTQLELNQINSNIA